MGFLRTVIPLRYVIRLPLRYVIRLPLRYVIRLTEGLPCELRELYELYELRELNRREPDSPDSRNSPNHDTTRELDHRGTRETRRDSGHQTRWRFKGRSVLLQRAYIAL